LRQESIVRVKNSATTPAGIAQRPGDGEKRSALISQAALLLGASWARSWYEALRREGRRVDGGWPGTRSESRFKVRHYLDGELSKLGFAALDHVEIERATATAYGRARSDWLSFVNSRKASRRRIRAASVEEN
jgi:hypothetical protein